MLLGCLLLEMRVEACEMHWICSNHFADLCRLEFRAKGTEQGGMCPTDKNLLPCNPLTRGYWYTSLALLEVVYWCVLYMGLFVPHLFGYSLVGICTAFPTSVLFDAGATSATSPRWWSLVHRVYRGHRIKELTLEMFHYFQIFAAVTLGENDEKRLYAIWYNRLHSANWGSMVDSVRSQVVWTNM